MSKYERPTKAKEPNVVMAADTAEVAAGIQKDVVENIIAKDKFVKYDQANSYAKGHNFKDTIVEVKKHDPFQTTIANNSTLDFPLCSINFLSQRVSQDEVGKKIAAYLGTSLVTKVYLMEAKGKDDQKILAVLSKALVVNHSPAIKYAIDRCKTGEEFKISKENIAPKLIALMSDTESEIAQYGDDLVVVLDPVKVVESVIIPSQLTNTTIDTLNLIKLSKVKIAKRQVFFAIKTEGALSSPDLISLGENNFVSCDLNVPYERFMSLVGGIWNHLYESVKNADGKVVDQKLRHPIPTVKYFDVLKIVGADVKDSAIRRSMLGINETSVARAPIVKLDEGYRMPHKVTGNPLLDAIYAQKSNYTQVETKFNVDEIMRDFGFLLNGEVHTYAVANENYLLVDTKKLFIATMFPNFYSNSKSNFKFKITVNPDTVYGIGCTMSI